VLDTLAVVGKTCIWVLEGSADPKAFIPQLIHLWEDGRFPFDRLIEEFPLTAIDEAEEASLSGRVIKPVLRPLS
jgi:aryl-alcohol dehydrogenase